MSYEFGDIVLVPFPFTNHAASKKRPAVVASSLRYNQSKPDLVVMAVTSRLRDVAAFGEVLIADWHGAGLLKPSAIKPVFATIEQMLIVRRLGRLTAADLDALRSAMSDVLG